MAWADQSFLGAGELYVDVYDDDGNLTGELDVGNATSFVVHAPDIETREILTPSSYGYLQATDQCGITRSQQIGFTLTDINRKNLALAMFGTDAVLAQAAGNNSGSPETIVGHVEKWTKLAARNLDPENPPVVQNAGETTTYTEGTDYEIDYQVGRVMVIDGGTIGDGDSLHVTCTWLAANGWQIDAGTMSRLVASLRMVGRDRSSGRDCEVIIHKASLMHDGDIQWIGGEMASISFSGQLLATDDGLWRVLFT